MNTKASPPVRAGKPLKCVLAMAVLIALAQPAAALNRFVQKNLVSSDVEYCPTVAIKPAMLNAWGVAIAPTTAADAHFWVTANLSGQSQEFVGDDGTIDLHTDVLSNVKIPGAGGALGTPTGVAYNASAGFVISQGNKNGLITEPAKYVFASDDGTISAWTERPRDDGGFDRPSTAKLVIDRSGAGAKFFGVGISPTSERMFVADFGLHPQVRVFDGQFREITGLVPFRNPFTGPNGPIPGDFVPFNVQVLDDGVQEHVFVTYTKSQADPDHPGHILPGEEDSGPQHGRLVEYDVGGNLVAVWQDRGLLNSPWGIGYAPASFTIGDHVLLVGNFGDGTVVAFDTNSRQARYYLQDPFGNPVRIEGLWGLQFGNGVQLGEANHVYFGAGPDDETQGVFGKLLPQFPETPESKAATKAWLAHHQRCTITVGGVQQPASCAIPCTQGP